MDYTIKDGYENMDFAKVAEMLAGSYWTPGIGIDEVKTSAANSAVVVGAFLPDGGQIGFARAVSDATRFAYIMDVIVDEKFRGNGIGQALVKAILGHPSLKDVYRWLLATKDAQGVYAKVGFTPLKNPDHWMEIRRDRPER